MVDRLLVYQARASVYALLQRLYQAAPDRDLLDWLLTEHPFREFPLELDSDAQASLEQLDTALDTEPLDALRQDFTQLFIGPGPMLAPPWESVYRNEEHLLFDQHTLQVRETYARHGMEFVRLHQMPEDAIAIELEFMKVLTERLQRAIEVGDSAAERLLLHEQQQFLRQHLLIWLPRFTAMIRKNAATAFYRGLADVLTAFVAWEEQAVALLLEQLVEDTPASSGGC